MSKFNLDTDFCRQCGCDSGWCDGCVKKKYYQQGRTDAVDEFIKTIKPRMKWDNDIYTLAIEHCIEVAKQLKEQK